MTNQTKFRLPVLTLIIISIMMSLCLVFSGCGGGSGGGTGLTQASPAQGAPVPPVEPAPNPPGESPPDTSPAKLPPPPSPPSLVQLAQDYNKAKAGACFSKDTQGADLTGGWNTISFPFDSVTSTSGFTYQLYWFDGTGYNLIDPTNASTIDYSKGYWAYFNSPTTISADGNYTGNITSVTLHQGWNFFGCPQRTTKKFSDITITYNGETKTLADASSWNTSPPITSWTYCWIYSYSNNAWQMQRTTTGGNELAPWKGYWIWSWVDGATLNFVKPKYAYVSCKTSLYADPYADPHGYIYVININNFSIENMFTLERPFSNIIISPDNRCLYGGGGGLNFYGNVLIIDAYNYNMIANIDIGQSLTNANGKLTFSPDGKYLYVPNFNSIDPLNTNPRVSIVDTSTNTVIDTIPLTEGWPWEVACHPNKNYIYVGSANILVIDTNTNEIITTIDLGEDMGFPDIALTPDGNYLYVAPGYDKNFVSVIDTNTNQIIANIIVGSYPNGIAIAKIPSGKTYAYVTNSSSNTVSVIDTSNNSLIAIINVGYDPDPDSPFGPYGGPVSPTITSDGAFLFVPLCLDKKVEIIDTLTNTKIHSISLEFFPYWVAIQH